MKCKKCNKEILDESIFCSFCGAKQVKKQSKKEYEYKRVTFTFEGRQYDTYGKTLKEAHAKAAKKKFELENALVTTGGNMLVKDWALKWFDAYKSPNIGTGQYKNYMSHIKGVIIPAIGNKRLNDIRDIDLQELLNSRADKSKYDLTKLRICIKGIFSRARISRLIPYDPSENLILPAAENGSYRSITTEERKAILGFAEKHYAGLWIKTMLYCGLRPGETRALNWKHIDFPQKLLYVEKSMKAKTNIIGLPKSKSGVRHIPIPDKLYNDYLEVRGNPDEPVFTQPTTGKRHTNTSMNCLWNNFKRELDISLGAKVYRSQIIESKIADDLVPYCLRHTYGTDLQDAGVPINIAKYLMGHSDITVTANIYTDTTMLSIKEAANKINKFAKKT